MLCFAPACRQQPKETVCHFKKSILGKSILGIPNCFLTAFQRFSVGWDINRFSSCPSQERFRTSWECPGPALLLLRMLRNEDSAVFLNPGKSYSGKIYSGNPKYFESEAALLQGLHTPPKEGTCHLRSSAGDPLSCYIRTSRAWYPALYAHSDRKKKKDLSKKKKGDWSGTGKSLLLVFFE